MKVMAMKPVEVVSDILCDVCLESTKVEGGGMQCGTLHAHWGYGSSHDGERYEIHLCETCFFQAVAGLKQERRVHTMFSETASDRCTDNFGLVSMSAGVNAIDEFANPPSNEDSGL